MKDTSLIYFLHIPKTSGTSFTKFLTQYFSPEEIFPGSVWSDYYCLHPVNWSQYRFVRGHFAYGFIQFLPADTRVITMLRDPVERLISQYHHVLSDPHVTHMLKGRAIRDIGGGNLAEALKDLEVQSYFAEPHVKHLGLTLNLFEDLKEPENTYTRIGELLAKYSEGQLLTPLLEVAKERLRAMYFFGLQEYFTQSYLLLGYLMGVDPIYDGSRNMVFENRPNQESFAPEVLDQIKSLNRLDTELYQYGKELFIDRYMETFSMLATSLRKPTPTFHDTEAVYELIRMQQRLFY